MSLCSAILLATNTVIHVIGYPVVESEESTVDGAEVVTVGGGQLERLAAQDVQTALRHVPGVTISRFSPIGSFGGSQGGAVYVRGTGASRPGGTLTVLRDGVPAMGSFFNHPLMDLTPIDFADSLKVVKTPRPRTLPNAFSAVELETWKQEVEGYGGEGHVAYGRFGSFLSSLTGGVKEGPFDFAAGGAHRESRGARDHGTSRLDSAFARAGLELGETEYLTFLYHFSDSLVEDPGRIGEPTPKYEQFGTQMNSYALRLETRRDQVTGSSCLYFTDGRIRWRKDHYLDPVPTSPWGYSRTNWATWGYRGLYDARFGDFTASVGLDVMNEEGRTEAIRGSDGQVAAMPVPKYERELFTAPYVGAAYEWGLTDSLVLTPSVGARYYFHDTFDNEVAPHAALDLGTRDYGVFASYQRGVHYPGLIFIANREKWGTDDCSAETMDNFNVGFRADFDRRVKTRLSVYHNRVRDRLDQDRNGLYHNAGELDATGLEGSVRVNVTTNLALFGGFAVNHARQKRVARLPVGTVTLGASYRFLTYCHFDVDTEFVDKMYAYSTRAAQVSDLEEVKAYWTLNARFAVDTRVLVPLDGEWYVAFDNILDQRYSYFPGYEMPGLMVYTGLKFRF